jgi:hypothetical protein
VQPLHIKIFNAVLLALMAIVCCGCSGFTLVFLKGACQEDYSNDDWDSLKFGVGVALLVLAILGYMRHELLAWMQTWMVLTYDLHLSGCHSPFAKGPIKLIL